MMKNDSLVFSIIVNYNGSQWVNKCYESLINSSVKNHKILTIDNNSNDSTISLIRKNYPTVEIIETGLNIGFGRANNIGIQKAIEAEADYIFLLNQDAWVENSTIEMLISIAEKYKDYAIISPIHKNSTEEKLDTLFHKYILESDFNELLNDYAVNKVKDIYEISFVNAAAWLLPKKTIEKVGYFDPFFFMYGEDDNYIQRIKFHNFKIGIAPKTSIVHDRKATHKLLNPDQLFNRKKSAFYKIILNPNNNPAKCIVVAFSYLTYNILSQILCTQFSVAYRLLKFAIIETFNITEILKQRNTY